MEHVDIEQIARLVVRDYGLPLRFDAVSAAEPGRCIVGFTDPYSRATTSVGIWCDAKASPRSVRESLKQGLQVND